MERSLASKLLAGDDDIETPEAEEPSGVSDLDELTSDADTQNARDMLRAFRADDVEGLAAVLGRLRMS